VAGALIRDAWECARRFVDCCSGVGLKEPLMNRFIVTSLLFAATLTMSPAPSHAAEPAGLPSYLYDRGDGISTSMLGTYVREKELLVYTFYEYTRTNKFEYKPSQLGFTGDTDFFGKAIEREFLVFFAYAFNDSLAIEFESALHSSIDFRKDSADTSAVPARIRESGLGDTETNIRWRFQKETEARPEVTFFFKSVFPLQKDKKLLGSKEWEFSPGVVLTKGFSFGTLALRTSAGYSSGDRTLELGETGIDYVKRLSQNWRVAFSVEGQQDDWSMIGELQYSLGKNAVLKINSGIGLTKKAPDFAPEIGVLFRF
jgi:hypothetical protein